MIENFIKDNQENMIKHLQELIQIPSVYSESKNPLMPFGENANKALEYMLNLGKQLGFKTKNVDGYCGYIEFGEGKEMVGIIGHLDVVPSGDNWTYPPFSGTVFDNKIYGRGAIDDKGPVVASLYAMKYVLDNCKVNKRVRLILGLNEENDWKCMDYYKAHEEAPSIGFSPDADFPCIYAEKSILTPYFSMDYSENSSPISIKELDCNQNAINVVPKICHVVLKIAPSLSMNDFIKNIKEICNNYDFEIDTYKLNDEEVKLTAHGIGAHAAHPDLGINAISRLVIILNDLFKAYTITNPLFDFFANYINTEYDGKSLGMNYKDESGSLTLNVGDISLENGILKIGLNLRIPIHTPIEEVENKFLTVLADYPKITYTKSSSKPGLYIPKDNYLVKTLCDIYNEEANSYLEPIAIGGATYARAFDNCISFGANLPGQKDMCHQTDEFISIDNLLFACKVYTKAICELGKNS